MQRQNVVKQHFVCIAKRVAVHGVDSNAAGILPHGKEKV